MKKLKKSNDFVSLVSLVCEWQRIRIYSTVTFVLQSFQFVWEREKQPFFFRSERVQNLNFKYLKEKLLNASFTLIKHLKHLNFYSIFKCFSPQLVHKVSLSSVSLHFPLLTIFSHFEWSFWNSFIFFFKQFGAALSHPSTSNVKYYLFILTEIDWLKFIRTATYRMHTYWIHILLDDGKEQVGEKK